jgi:hypothetical protein
MPNCSLVGSVPQCATDAPTSCKTRAPSPEKVPGSADPRPAGTPRRGEPLDTDPRKQDHIVNKHTVTVIAAAVVISLGVLGWYALAGYVVTITGSAGDLPRIADATARLIYALLGAATR